MGALPSPWRASAGALGLGIAAGAVLGGLVWTAEGSLLAGLFVAAFTFAVVGLGELQAGYRLTLILREFARQVSAEPEAETSSWGDQTVRWPDLGLEVGGGTRRFRVQGLAVGIQGHDREASIRRPREAAREALEALGHEPADEGLEARLPSLFPMRSALRFGLPVVAVGAFGVALGVGLGPVARALGVLVILVGLLVGVLRWAGLSRLRRVFVGLSNGPGPGGTPVERVDLIGGIFAPAYELRTDEDVVGLRCVAHPWGRVWIRAGGRTVEGRLQNGRWIEDAVADGLARSGAEPGAVADWDGLITTRALSFASFGVSFIGVGAMFLLRPRVITAGDCTRYCGVERVLETVPIASVAAGSFFLVLGAVMVAIATGRVPAPNHLRGR